MFTNINILGTVKRYTPGLFKLSNTRATNCQMCCVVLGLGSEFEHDHLYDSDTYTLLTNRMNSYTSGIVKL